MGIKKRNKVSAEFSMSSLTDIIFLLLIFFMLTSTLVAPNALNLKLPGSSTSKVTSTSKLDDVSIGRSGEFYLNSRRIDISDLENTLGQKARRAGAKNLDILISPEKGAPVENVVAVMDIAMRYDINGILAPEK
ncbi:MAG TPA: biopolymer transporter ExbD [Saprospiraceae bacterium]|nr:biopolymer transporter ExbD [Saprospiraceae bacterium]